MRISDYLKEEHIVLDLKVDSKKDAIKQIAQLLEGEKKITDFKKFVEDIYDREKLSTTGIGSGIAIPHSRSNSVNDFVIAFGRVPEGVDFDSLDNKPAKLIFLMGTPEEKGLQNYLQILARLTRLLKKESFKQDILNAAVPQDIINIFKKVYIE